ncbi:MAG: nitroreductase family protein [Candidatus Micrarchaeota archaeon]
MVQTVKSLYQAVNDRRSVRVFTDKQIEPEKLQRILETARNAPQISPGSYSITVVQDPKQKADLRAASLRQKYVETAPTDLVVLVNKYDLPSIQDATTATAYADLTTHVLGLGSVWIGAFHPDQVGQIVGARPRQVPVAILCCGEPEPRENVHRTPRRPLDDLITVIGRDGHSIPYHGIGSTMLGSRLFFDVIERRISTRKFTGKPIEEAKIHRIIESANRAPSAGNLQAYDLMLFTDPTLMKIFMRTALGQKTNGEGALLIVMANQLRSSIKYRERGAELYCLQDATIAAAYADLAAQDVGLGTNMITKFNIPNVAALIGANRYQIPIAVLAIGNIA